MNLELTCLIITRGTVAAVYDGSGIQDLCVYRRIPRIILIYGVFIGVDNSISILFHLKRKHQLNGSKHLHTQNWHNNGDQFHRFYLLSMSRTGPFKSTQSSLPHRAMGHEYNHGWLHRSHCLYWNTLLHAPTEHTPACTNSCRKAAGAVV